MQLGDKIVVVLRPTGAGKTTVLQMVSGLDKPDAARFPSAGAHGGRHPGAARCDEVFRKYSRCPHLTLRENLAFPLQSPLLRTPKAEIARKMAEVAEIPQISLKLDNKATALSGGDARRLGHIGRGDCVGA